MIRLTGDPVMAPSMTTREMEQEMTREGVDIFKNEDNYWVAMFADEEVARNRRRGDLIWLAASALNLTKE